MKISDDNMKCSKCGSENPENAVYCQQCGGSLSVKKFGEFTNSTFINTILWMIIASILGEIYTVITMPLIIFIMAV